LDYLHPELYEAAFAGVAGVAGATGAFVFDAPALFAGTAFLAGADFFATFAVEAFFVAFRTFAHRSFWAAAILARAPALKERFFLLFARNPTAGAFFAVDTATVLGAAFFAAFLDFAQRALWAAAIFSGASALNVRFVLALPAKLVLTGRPGFRFSVVLVPLNIQYPRAEVSDQLLRQDRPNSLHEAASQVPFDTLACRWRDGFQNFGLELKTVLFIPDPPSFCGQPLPGAHRRQGAEDCHQVPLPPDLHPEYGEPALFVKEGDPFYESRDLF